MTHYLLNYFDVRFIFAKPCTKRMAKNMATEVRDDNGFSIFFLSFLLLLFVAQWYILQMIMVSPKG